MGSNHGPHHSSANKLHASEASADNVSTSGLHGDDSAVGGMDTRVAKKGSDGKSFMCLVMKCKV